METDRGLVCIEVNSGGEFHGLMTTTDVDIADEIVREALAAATHFTGSLLASEEVIEAQPSAL
jgi:hypothetical protein